MIEDKKALELECIMCLEVRQIYRGPERWTLAQNEGWCFWRPWNGFTHADYDDGFVDLVMCKDCAKEFKTVSHSKQIAPFVSDKKQLNLFPDAKASRTKRKE